jgi:hypothetical protein
MRTIRLTREWLAIAVVVVLFIYPVLAMKVLNITQPLPLGLYIPLGIALALGFPGTVFLLAFVISPKERD